jgi:hypothetical protein
VSIDVSGGIGGIGVGLDEVEAAARVLGAVAEDVAAASVRVALLAADPHLVASHVISPLTGARSEVALAGADGPSGLAGQAAALGALAVATRGAVAAYREGERAVAASAALAEDAVMYVVGAHAPEVAVGVLTLSALGLDVGALLDRAAYHLPVLSELGGGSSGLVLGLAQSPVTGPAVAAASLGRLGRERDLSGDPADSDAEALRILGDAGAIAGLLHDGGVPQVTAELVPRAGARAPTGVEALARDTENLSDGDEYPAHVRVVEVPGATGSAWLVEISGTQAWDPHAGSNPFDVTSDVRLMAQQSTVLADGVQQALAQAQAASGRNTAEEPVMLTGHSLGGIVAAGLASSPRFREAHRVTDVVTLGSPVARMPVPESVRVLSLEHGQDPVPRLDGRANPDRRTWVTVTRDLRGDPDRVHTASGSHATGEYAQTGAAVDASGDASLAQWRATSHAFFEPAPGRQAIVRDYRVVRAEVAPLGHDP